MRLTLRTLLAYLDNTLEPQDAEALRNKLAESGFATQLVQRIRGTLAGSSLAAPSPEAVGPVEEANVISEYLDSTLPAEQVAEIERACLESDPHLAEAAACHQILTMVLGKPAEVSPELRQRIYELPDRQIEDIAVAGSFSAVAIPAQQPLQSLTDDLPTIDLTSPSQPVRPVGVADSGVSDAPTRLREAGAIRGDGKDLTTAKARSKARSARDIYGGSIRPSRIAPWLVSLALAAVLLFVLARIFQPLLNHQTAGVDPIDSAPIVEIEVAAEEAPIMVDIGPPSGTADSTNAEESAAANEEAAILPAPEVLPTPNVAPAIEPAPAEDVAASAEPTSTAEPAPNLQPTDAGDSGPTKESVDVAVMPVADPADKSDSPSVGDVAAAEPEPPPSAGVASDAANPKLPPAVDAVEGAKKELARVTGDKALLAALVGDQWVRLDKDMVVGEGLKISCAPTFRGQMGTDDAKITLVGPAQVEWLVDQANEVTLHIEFGQVLISATKPDTSFKVQLGAEPVEVGFADIDSVVGASVEHFRAPGFDPLQVEHRIPLSRVLSVQGSLMLKIEDREETLQTGQQWVKRGSSEAKISPVEEVPAWIDPPDLADTSLEAGAREGLLELIKGDQTLEIALREATLFRRSEVAALAGQTLLNLGIGDVYFGGDGILSEPKQRAYWPDHFTALMSSVDRSAASAARLRASIVKMDSANAQPLFRLLTGYSQKQLVEGGDEELVDLLDSSSMAVRVMALESLHKITGTTLYFRAEQENAVRRGPGIKKWVARQRKGDIRWQE